MIPARSILSGVIVHHGGSLDIPLDSLADVPTDVLLALSKLAAMYAGAALAVPVGTLGEDVALSEGTDKARALAHAADCVLALRGIAA